MSAPASKPGTDDHLTVDRVVSHWAVKVLVAALVALGGMVVRSELKSIDSSISRQTEAVGALRAEVQEFKSDLTALASEYRTFRESTTTQYHGLASRIDDLERWVELREENEKVQRLRDWELGLDRYDDNRRTWERRNVRSRETRGRNDTPRRDTGP